MIDPTYPSVVDEWKTLELMHQGKSIARFGDGEFRICLGRYSMTQEGNEKLRNELNGILKTGTTENCLVAIPPINDPKITPQVFWKKGGRTKKYHTFLNPNSVYYSSYMTRPDFQPSLNTKDYYESMIDLWRNKDVVVISGVHPTDGTLSGTLRHGRIAHAKSVQMILGPRKHAYAEIDRIETEIGQTNKPVLICLGAAATVLAWRLSKKGILAWDLGHVGNAINKYLVHPSTLVENK